MSEFYETVHAHPDGESTAARMAVTATECNFSGIIVRNAPAALADGPNRNEIADEYGIDVVDAVEISSEEPSVASSRVKEYREEHTLVAVRGSSALNRFACEEPRVDMLARPMANGDVNHVLARAAKRNGVRFEFDFGRVLRQSGGRRVQALADLRKLREIVSYYDAPYVVSASPTSHLEVRAPRELLALGEEIGFDREGVAVGLAEWAKLAGRNRDRLSESFIAPGVRRGKYEEDD